MNFIETFPVDLTALYDPMNYVFGLLESRTSHWAERERLRASVCSLPMMTVDLDILQRHGREWASFRPCAAALRATVAAPLRSDIPDTPEEAITGYYFPYKAGLVTAQIEESVGFVDVPRVDPAHNFVFTGSMNGCELIVTESPGRPDLLRFWHFQNAETNRRFRFDGSVGWPGRERILYWHEFSAYGENTITPTEIGMCGWNFFHYDAGRWWLYVQPLNYASVDPTTPVEKRKIPRLKDMRPRRIDILANPFRPVPRPEGLRAARIVALSPGLEDRISAFDRQRAADDKEWGG